MKKMDLKPGKNPKTSKHAKRIRAEELFKPF